MAQTFNTWREFMADAIKHPKHRESNTIVMDLQFTPSAEALARAEEIRLRVRAALDECKVEPLPPRPYTWRDKVNDFFIVLLYILCLASL